MLLTARRNFNRAALFFIFTLSGFSGLIYELIWTHYLKLFLGHAAYAQTLVLMIFMGGMALGAWIIGQYTRRIQQLFLAYIIVEIGIGLMGVFFDPFFRWFLLFSYEHVIPNLMSVQTISWYKWGLSSLIILPQSILLGMTFPLMSNAIIRRFPEYPGSILAMLYFTNSLGAAIGVLVCGFYLIPTAGLPGALLIAGFCNFIVALFTYAITRIQYTTDRDREIPTLTSLIAKQKSNLFCTMIVAALITGLGSFMYEIGWIRLLSMVLGSATHSFELMLSSFILGLACGGLWMKHRIDRLSNPIYFLSLVQMIMGLLALLSLLTYSKSFYVMQFFITALTKTEPGYFTFNVISYGIAMMVMLPATFCAGTTLPLITRILLNDKKNEKVVGQVYASNTVGAILGVLIAIHWVMPLLSLKSVIVIGALFDITLGYVLCVYADSVKKISALFWITVTFLALGWFSFFVQLNPEKMASGVFRTGKITQNGSVIFLQDGKTATISVSQTHLPNHAKQLVIATNGKPDASLGFNMQTDDEITQVFLGVLPASLDPNAKNAAVIGFGSGITSHLLLEFPTLQQVDTVEIEPAMIAGAKHFLPYNRNAYESPRSRLIIQDAKVFFANTHHQFDMIISEPSNPWVSGVASLFTQEFYTQIKKHLSAQGVFCQWLHSYEMNWSLIVSILKSLDQVFPQYVIYEINDGDFLILAKKDESIAWPSDFVFQIPAVKTALDKVSIKTISDIRLRFVANRAILHPFLTTQAIANNSDYFPIVDVHAVRTRFLKQQVSNFGYLGYWLPIDLLLPKMPVIHAEQVTANTQYTRAQLARLAWRYYASITNKIAARDTADRSLQIITDILNPTQKICDNQHHSLMWQESLWEVGSIASLYLSPSQNKTWLNIVAKKACLDDGHASINQQWIALFQAISEKHIQSIRTFTQQLLSQPNNTSNTELLPYLVGVQIIAALADDDKKAAQDTWKQYQSAVIQALQQYPRQATRLEFSLQILRAISVGAK